MPSTAATLTARVRKAAKVLQNPPPDPCDGRRCHYGISHRATDHAEEDVLRLFKEATAVAWRATLPPHRTPLDLILYPDGSIAYFNAADDPTRIHTGTITNPLERSAATAHLDQQEKDGKGSQLVERNLTHWLRRQHAKRAK